MSKLHIPILFRQDLIKHDQTPEVREKIEEINAGDRLWRLVKVE